MQVPSGICIYFNVIWNSNEYLILIVTVKILFLVEWSYMFPQV